MHGSWKGRECPCACINISCCCTAQCSCLHHPHNTLNLLWLPPGGSRHLHCPLNPRNPAQPALSGHFGGSKRSHCHILMLIQAAPSPHPHTVSLPLRGPRGSRSPPRCVPCRSRPDPPGPSLPALTRPGLARPGPSRHQPVPACHQFFPFQP